MKSVAYVVQHLSMCPGLNSAGSDAIRALSLLLVVAFAPRGFYISGFLSSKPNSSKSWDGGKMRKNGGMNG